MAGKTVSSSKQRTDVMAGKTVSSSKQRSKMAGKTVSSSKQRSNGHKQQKPRKHLYRTLDEVIYRIKMRGFRRYMQELVDDNVSMASWSTQASLTPEMPEQHKTVHNRSMTARPPLVGPTASVRKVYKVKRVKPIFRRHHVEAGWDVNGFSLQHDTYYDL